MGEYRKKRNADAALKRRTLGWIIREETKEHNRKTGVVRLIPSYLEGASKISSSWHYRQSKACRFETKEQALSVIRSLQAKKRGARRICGKLDAVRLVRRGKKAHTL
jgi:hypothetical protein